MLKIVNTILYFSLNINWLINKIERLDTSCIDLHKTITPRVESIVNSISTLLGCLRTVIVRIITYLYLLDIDSNTAFSYNTQISVSYSTSTLSLNYKLGPFTLLKRPLTVNTISCDNISREIYTKSNVLIGLCPKRCSVFSQRIHLEAFDDAYI